MCHFINLEIALIQLRYRFKMGDKWRQVEVFYLREYCTFLFSFSCPER